MIGKTSSKVIERYKAKMYDRLYVFVPKGEKERIADQAERKGFIQRGKPSINAYIKSLIDNDLKG
jgi:hypothetical protein